MIKKNSLFNRHQLQLFLERNKIQTRPIFSGNFLKQPAFKKIKYRSVSKGFVNADYVTDNGLMFGLHHGLTDKHIKYIKKIFNKFISKYH